MRTNRQTETEEREREREREIERHEKVLLRSKKKKKKKNVSHVQESFGIACPKNISPKIKHFILPKN